MNKRLRKIKATLDKVYSDSKNQPSQKYLAGLKNLQARAISLEPRLKATLTVTARSKIDLIQELKDMVLSIGQELNSTICKECNRKGSCHCQVGGGTSEDELESDWNLYRER